VPASPGGRTRRGRPSPSIEVLRFDRFESRLRDGTPVVVRPVESTDKQLLLAGFERLSPESRYARFMAPVVELSEEQLRYLTEIDYVDHFAWAALRADRPGEGIGVARYVRLADEPDVAEAAITVLDQYQGQGLGTLLLALLAVAARAAGIRWFRAFVLEENAPMRVLLEALGAEASHDSPGVLRMDVPLDPQLLPDSPAARVLKAVAENLVELTGPPPHWIGPEPAAPARPRRS
jgi:GNAT superfamily N-acetyltransferase